MIIDRINSPADLKKIPIESLPELANEIRTVLLQKASQCGGHLGSNLGVVELTIALHYVFDSPKDKIIFDVSHQCYVHKMLTGRKDAFIDKARYGSVSGYTNPLESPHDIFNVGHTSTSISLACGLAKARELCGGEENIIAVIGDASLDGGEAFEALNYAAELNDGLIVVINDNDMSIPENHGALCEHLAELRKCAGRCKNNYFESLGFEYFFVEDGHCAKALIAAFERVKSTDHPVAIHVVTQKGKGYSYAEEDREKWHWAHPFNLQTGEFNKTTAVPKENYGAIVGEYLMKKIKADPTVVAMTASVPAYIGFNSQRRREAGKQYVDVGIAEQNGVTMAAAIAKRGGKPIFVTGSSFYQRAYDQIEQEMCINKCAATMLVAFSGINGHDSNAHAGLYDMALLSNIPGLIYLAPSNKQEYIAMLEWSIEQNESPVAIRIPWNGVHYADEPVPLEYSRTKYWIKKCGTEIAILGLGSFYQLAEEVANQIVKEMGVQPTLIDPMFVTGLDEEMLECLKQSHRIVVTLEDGIIFGGFGARIAQYYGPSGMRVLNYGFSMEIPTVFTVKEMLRKNRLTPELILADIKLLRNSIR